MRKPAPPVLLVAALIAVAAIVVLAQAPSSSSFDSPYPFRAAAASASPRLAKLRTDIRSSGQAAVDAFWNEIRQHGAPIVEPAADERHSLVTFVWRGSAEAKNVVVVDGVALGVGGVDPANSRMTRIPETDVWFRTYDVRNDARFTYALSENDPLTSFVDPNRKSNSKPDPLNSRKFSTGQSYLELRDAPPQPWVAPRSPEMSGTVKNTTLNNRAVWVYTPAGFQTAGERYPLVVTLAAPAYMNLISLSNILDNAIAEKRIPPVVAAAVAGAPADLMCSPEYADFLAREVVPWMQKNYHATNDPKQTVIGGSSLGGLASTFAAVSHPEVFGKVLSQSGSYWWKPDNEVEGEWLTKRVASTEKLPVDFFIEVGRMEAPEDQLAGNRRMRDALVAKGYRVQYQEFNGNHTYLAWRGTFGAGLVSLLAK